MTTRYMVQKSCVKIALLLCTPLLLLLSNLYLLATPFFIRYEYSKPYFLRSSVYTVDERLFLAEATLHYLRSNEDVSYLTRLQSHGQTVYNTREIRHLEDVKRVMRATFWLHRICALLWVLAAVFSWRCFQERSFILSAVYSGCLILFALLAVLGILAYTNFDLFFTAFHRLFFEGDSWLFAFSDTLIQLFPVQFWIDTTWRLLLLTMGECLIVGTGAYAYSRHLKGAL